MKIDFTETFDKQFSKLSRSQKLLVRDTIELFSEDPLHHSLRNHPLKDKWAKYRSISADEDLRLHFRLINKERALFVALGSHKQLYK